MNTRCICDCHRGSVTDRMRADGVSVTDPVEAAVACPSCLKHHAAALLDPDRAPLPPPDESGEFSPPTQWTPGADATCDTSDTADDEDGG